jgi:hypothetical protein
VREEVNEEARVQMVLGALERAVTQFGERKILKSAHDASLSSPPGPTGNRQMRSSHRAIAATAIDPMAVARAAQKLSVPLIVLK